MIRRAFLGLAIVAVACTFATAADKAWSFQISVDKSEEFRFKLTDADGTAVVQSQGYKKKADCTKMVDNLKEKMADYKVEYSEDKAKKTRFNIVAKNGQTVASSSKGYDTKADAEKAVAAMQKAAKDATVVDEAKK